MTRNATNAKNFRFIKVDGFAPTNLNVVTGKYRMWTEMGLLGPAPTDPLALDIIANLGDSHQIAALNNILLTFLAVRRVSWERPLTFNLSSPPSFNLPVPGCSGLLVNAAYDDACPVNPYTHSFLSGTLDHCLPETIPPGAGAMPVFYPN
jgi:hypothetical protein